MFTNMFKIIKNIEIHKTKKEKRITITEFLSPDDQKMKENYRNKANESKMKSQPGLSHNIKNYELRMQNHKKNFQNRVNLFIFK